MNPGQFILREGPIRLAVAQVGLSHTPEFESEASVIQSGLKEVGLAIAEAQQQANLTFSATQPPKLKSQNVWYFSNPNRTRGVATSTSSYAYVTTAYDDFDEFVGAVKAITRTVADVAKDAFFTTVGLRYLNIFPVTSIPTDLLHPALGGMPLDNLPTSHFHHRYEFWCDTNSGKLIVRCQSAHGDQSPPDLGHAAYFFSPPFGKSVNVYQLDIFENSRAQPIKAPLEDAAIEVVLRDQHDRIEQAFLNCVTENALNLWGVGEKQ